MFSPFFFCCQCMFLLCCFLCALLCACWLLLAGCLRGSNQGVGAKTTERNTVPSVIFFFSPDKTRSFLFLAAHQQVLEAAYSAKAFH